MSVLSIVSSTMGRMSLTKPTVVVTSADLQVQQMYELLKEAALALTKHGSPDGWQALRREQTFVTNAAPVQTNTPIPADFLRFVPNSFWNRSTVRPVTGPLTSQQWQLLQARPALAPLYLAYREINNTFEIGPTPPDGQTIAFEYISSFYAISSAGQAKAEFTSDDDTTYLDEELLKLSLRWRWKQAKGLDYGEDMATYERELQSTFGGDGGATMLNISGPRPLPFPEALNIPEGNFPG